MGDGLDVGFETIGNATVIFHDRGPKLVTDPWIVGGAYFGSWRLSHEIPEAQRGAIHGSPYIWLSHGHPDHLSGDSLALLRDKKILVPDHVGGRVFKDLKEQGFDVHVLPDRAWVELSPRLRVMSIPDYNQDAVLLADVGGVLVANLNDAGPRGWGRFVRRIVGSYARSFLLALSGYGDADMMNFFDEKGAPLPPPAARRTPVGQTIAQQCDWYGAKFFVPFSSMHRYQRADSVWANKYTTALDDYPRGFDSKTAHITPAFIRYDCAQGRLDEIRPREAPDVPRDPKEFGDDWSEPLEKGDAEKIASYFRSIESLHATLDFIRFKVGGREHVIFFDGPKKNRGLTFEAPRNSLMTAVSYEVFDDLLIGNFMKTTLHGAWGEDRLYPDFSPFVGKYADNGRARTAAQLKKYFAAYRARDPLDFVAHRFDVTVLQPLQRRSAEFLRAKIDPHSVLFRAAKKAYWGARKIF